MNKDQEQGPICQRESCPMQGTTYGEVTRRVTLETLQEVTFPVTLSGLAFSDRRITVDLCILCYHILTHDQTVKMLRVVGIGAYAEGQS